MWIVSLLERIKDLRLARSVKAAKAEKMAEEVIYRAAFESKYAAELSRLRRGP